MEKVGYYMPCPALFEMEMRAIPVFKIKKIGIERIMISIINTVSKVNVSMIEMYVYAL